MKYPNIVLIIIDTLRADHLSCYGYHRPTSPNIDKIAKEGALFESVVSQAPWTLPSVASILTSRYPKEIGMIHKNSKFNETSLLAADIFKKKNYDTGSFVSGGFLSGERGFNKGSHVFREIQGRAEEINMHAFDWLDKKRSKPFFLWLHYFDVHSDYDAPSPFDKLFDEKMLDLNPGKTTFLQKVLSEDIIATPSLIEKIKLLYDRGIAYTDFHIGRLIEKLRYSELLEDTIVVIASDHGDGFMEHGRVLHATTLYEELIHVPLIIRFPKKISKNIRIFQSVQNLDILPTLIDLSFGEMELQLSGKTLLPLIEGHRPKENFTFSHTNMASLETDNPYNLKKSLFDTIFMVRKGQEKLIFNKKSKTYELYNLKNDPDEQNNIHSNCPETMERLKKRLATWMQFLENNFLASQEIEMEKKMVERLRALGYM